MLDTVGFDELLEGADLVITGEGRIDSQSVHGKVISGIARRTKPRNIPLLALVGSIGEDAGAGYDLGVTAMFSIDRSAQDFREYASRSAVYYPADPGGHPAADKSGTTTRLCGDDLLVCPHNATNQ